MGSAPWPAAGWSGGRQRWRTSQASRRGCGSPPAARDGKLAVLPTAHFRLPPDQPDVSQGSSGCCSIANLSNDYGGLSVQKNCPHANACLTCPVFVSGPEFLPELREQRHRTLTLIEVSSGKGPGLGHGDEPASPHQPGPDDQRDREEPGRRRGRCRRYMDATGRRISFDAVAPEASVARSWLYTQQDLRAEIERLCQRHPVTMSAPSPQRQRASDPSLLRRMEAATTRIRQL